jgi:allophanate hydrolase subunit 2
MHAGMRSYLAVAGGIDCPMMLGSRSHDTLSGTSSGIVPLQLSDGAELSVGMPKGEPQGLDVPITPILDGRIRLSEGPHAELFRLQMLKQLLTKSGWTVLPSSNRIGVRLASSSNSSNSLVDELNSNSLGELDSMALVRGAVQLTPSGELVVMLADHPTTGGYPVIAVVHADDVDVMGQRSPGAMVNMVWTD